MLLAVYRELPGFVRAQDERRWDQHFTDELAGKRVLLVGAGDLAENTVRRLAPFEVTRRSSAGRPGTACTASTRCTTCSPATTPR